MSHEETEESCIGCLDELNYSDRDPNGDKNCVCRRCRAEEAHDFDREPSVVFTRDGVRVREEYRELEWIATVYPDWTALQILESGVAFGFNRDTGKVYRLPHKDSPLVQFTPTKLRPPNAT